MVVATGVHAQYLLVPAGRCCCSSLGRTEPFVGDGRRWAIGSVSFEKCPGVWPHGVSPGSMLAGHMEAGQGPGHFVGKGYLKLTFDRVIVQTGDIPLPAK